MKNILYLIILFPVLAFAQGADKTTITIYPRETQVLYSTKTQLNDSAKDIRDAINSVSANIPNPAIISQLYSTPLELVHSTDLGMVSQAHPQGKAYSVITYEPEIYLNDTVFNTIIERVGDSVVYNRDSGIKFQNRVGTFFRSVDPAYGNIGNVYSDNGWDFHYSVQTNLDKTAAYNWCLLALDSQHKMYLTEENQTTKNSYLLKSYDFGKTFVWAADNLLATVNLQLPEVTGYTVVCKNYKEFDSFDTDQSARFTSAKTDKTHSSVDGSQIFTVTTATNNLNCTYAKMNVFDTSKYYYIEYKAKGDWVTTPLSNLSGKLTGITIINDPTLSGSYQRVKYSFKPTTYSNTLYVFYPQASGNSGKYIQIDSLMIYSIDTLTEGIDLKTRYDDLSNAKLFANAVNKNTDFFAQVVDAGTSINIFANSFGIDGNYGSITINGVKSQLAGAIDYGYTSATMLAHCLMPDDGNVTLYHHAILAADDSIVFVHHDANLNIMLSKISIDEIDDIYHADWNNYTILPNSVYAEPYFARYGNNLFMTLRYQSATSDHTSLNTYPKSPIYKSSDNGITWTIFSSGVRSNKNVPIPLVVPKWDSRDVSYRDNEANDPYVDYHLMILNNLRYIGLMEIYSCDLSTGEISDSYPLKLGANRYLNYNGVSSFSGYKEAGTETSSGSAIYSSRYMNMYLFYTDTDSNNTQRESIYVIILRN